MQQGSTAGCVGLETICDQINSKQPVLFKRVVAAAFRVVLVPVSSGLGKDQLTASAETSLSIFSRSYRAANVTCGAMCSPPHFFGDHTFFKTTEMLIWQDPVIGGMKSCYPGSMNVF
jgi:hypothetical protein